MFESLLNQILNKVLGDYVENLDPKQLNLGIWGGDLELKDLIVKQSAFSELNLPVQCVFGRLKHLKAKIPWNNLFTSPVEVCIDGIFLLVRANNQVLYDAAKEEQREYEEKMDELKKIDEAKNRDKEAQKADDSWVSKMIMRIGKNCQVTIKNIHIRYEDCLAATPYAMGITLASFVMRTTNSQWEQAVLEEEETKAFKVVSLDSLSVYWNCHPEMYCGKADNEEMLQAFIRDVASPGKVPANYNYILGPISAQCRVKVNLKPENDIPQYSIPFAQVELVIECLNIGITKMQYKAIIDFAEVMAIQSNGVPYRKYRPNLTSYKGNYKAWWKFAYESILETQIRRKKRDWDWQHILHHREMCRSYADAYKAQLTKKLPKEQLDNLQMMEKKLDLLNIVLVRQRIELEVERLDKKRENKQGWFSSWWYRSNTADQEISDSTNLLKKFENAMTDEEKQKLYKAIDYTENAVPPDYPPEYKDLVLKFQLRMFEINVCNEEANLESVIKSKLNDVRCNIERRPVNQGLKFAMFVENLTVFGTPQDDFVPEMVSSKTDETTGLMDVLFELNPLNSNCGQRLHVKSKPLRIIFDSRTFNQLMDTFTIPSESSLEQISQVTANKINDFKEMSATGLQHVIDKHVSIDLDINLSAPYIIIPHGGMYTGSENVLVFYLGTLSLKSDERNIEAAKVKEMYQQGLDKEEVMNQLKNQIYDKFIFEMSNIQIMIAQSDEDYLKYIFEVVEVSPMHLLYPLSFYLTFETCLIADDPNLPLTKISGDMPSVSVSVSEARLLLLLNLANSVTALMGESQPATEQMVRAVSSTSLAKIYDYMDQKPKAVKIAEPVKNMTQMTMIKFNFILKELKISICRQDTISTPICELLQFNMNSVGIVFTQQTFNMDVDVSLSSITMKQNLRNTMVNIISSKIGNDTSNCLFNVKYIQVNRKSPEFHSVHGSCESAVVLNFAGLDIKLIQEGLLNVMQFANDIQGQLAELSGDAPKPPRISSGDSRKSSFSANSYKLLQAPSTIEKGKPKKITDEIMFKLIAEFKELTIEFEHNGNPLSSFSIGNISSEIIMKQAYTKIFAMLGSISIVDLNAVTLHKTILTVLPNEKALTAEVIMYNNDVVKASCDMAVTASLGRMKICFINWYINNMLNFANNFQAAQEAIISASNKAAQSAKENMANLYEQATKIKIHVNLSAPEIYVPESSSSNCGLLIDLGHIMITNRFNELNIKNEIGHNAVVDELTLKLEDLKFERIKICDDLKSENNMTLLEPMSFTMVVSRNLSNWYTAIPSIDIDGNIHNVELKLGQPDYETIMSILNDNLSEGSTPEVKTPTVQSSASLQTTTTVAITERAKSEDTVALEDSQVPTTFIRWNLVMNCFRISLYTATYPSGSIITQETVKCGQYARVGLAEFSLEGFSIRGRMLSNNSLSNSLLLVNCLLIDKRPGREDKINCFLSRREEDERTPTDSTIAPVKNMIDVTLQQNRGDTFVDVRVYSFTFILSVEYMLKISNFFAPAEKKEAEVTAVQVKHVEAKPQEAADAPVNKNMMSLTLKVEKPYIILVEHLDSIDTRALILNCEVLTKLRFSGEHQNINGTVSDIQMYTCMFDPREREATKNSLLEPFTISVAGSTPEGKGLHIELLITDICISVSLYSIELIMNIMNTLSGTSVERKSDIETLQDFSDTWDIKTNEEYNFWFLKQVVAEDALSFDFSKSKAVKKLNELCIMNIPSIVMTLEAGMGNKTFPMLIFESHFEGKICDWSSQMTVDAILSLQMGYYNSQLALWEPLIEPVTIANESECKFKPWELKLEVAMNEANEENLQSPENEPGELSLMPAMSVDISSTHNLELTVTKTCLEVLSTLGTMFASAMDSSKMVKHEAQVAPYKIVNSSGMDIDVLLQGSDFTILGQDSASVVKLEKGAEVLLDLKSLNKKKLTLSDMDKPMQQKYLNILVPEMNCKLELNVTRADTRYFKLEKNSWGLVSSVKMENGVTTITICSILQIYNDFNTPIDLYYMRSSGNELELISTIQPGTAIYVPQKAVYSQTSELFFSVANYAVTSIPYVWKDLQLNVAVSKNLVCVSKKDNQDLFVIRAVGEMSQVYYENTSKYTMSSTIYTIHLKPAVILKNCLPIDITVCIRDVKNEVVIEPGCSWDFPNLEPGKSYMVIRLNYLEKEWSCRREIQLLPQQFLVWTFDSHAGSTKMSLDLGMHVLQNNGSFVLSLYCPFWMINKTGLVLSYRNSDENLNILHHPPFFKGPILFSFNAKNFFGKKKACIRIDNGEWSDKFSIDVAGSSGVIIVKNNGKMYQVGVSNRLTYNGLTKQITFTPYYVIINHSPLVMECQEMDRPGDPWIKVAPRSCTALWPFSEQDDRLIKVRIEGTSEITVPFLITESHNTLLKLNNKYGGIFVDIQLSEGAIYINLSLYDTGMAPAIIVNHTDYAMNIWEKESVQIKKLPAKRNMLYTWDNPSADRVIVWEAGYGKEIENDLRMDGFGDYHIKENETVYWTSFLDGMQRVLLFTTDTQVIQSVQASKQFEVIDMEVTVSIYGMGLSLVNNLKRQEIMYIGVASTGIIWETCKQHSKRFKQMNTKDNQAMEKSYQSYMLHQMNDESSTALETVMVDDRFEVNFDMMVMTRPHKRKIRRKFQTGIWLQMKTSAHQMQLHAKVNRLQIDNQLFDCIFPVLLAPVPPPKSVAADNAHKPFAELSIVQLLIKNSQIRQFKYFKVLIQEFHLKVDIGFINALMDVFESSENTDEQEKKNFLTDCGIVEEPLYAHVSTHSLKEQKSFYDLLHFSPLKIHVSFSMSSSQGMGNIPVFLSVLLQGIGVTLTDLQDVVFKLAFFQRDYTFLTQQQLMDEATTHYVGQTVKQLYVLVLGLDVLGNPYGLVVGISKGVEDLFYEPFQGAIQGPGEFAEGLVLGLSSLFGHTVGGAAGAVSRITGAMGKGIAALTFDKEYQRKRRDQISKKPATVQEGLARGGKGLVMGVVDGFTGVFTKPISGAKEQGVGGFFKGLGKGAVGLVTRPTAGVMDFASTSFETVKRVTDFGNEYVNRLRAPRFVQADRHIRPYNANMALGNKLLCELDKGKYHTTDIYSCHFTIIEKKEVLLFSDKRLAYIIHNDLFGGWQVEWSYTWPELEKEPTVVGKGVQIFTDAKKKGIFNAADNGKILLVHDPNISHLIVSKIIEHMNSK